jgi:hypothetical protein
MGRRMWEEECVCGKKNVEEECVMEEEWKKNVSGLDM